MLPELQAATKHTHKQTTQTQYKSKLPQKNLKEPYI